jgi:[histone H3]-lysine36 N-trimethyltransferase
MDQPKHPKTRAVGVARANETHRTNAASFQDASRHARPEGLKVEPNGAPTSPGTTSMDPSTQAPAKPEKMSQSPRIIKEEHQEAIHRDMVVKSEPAHPPKPVRAGSQKVPPRPAILFDSYPDKTEESKDTFQVIGSCIYSSKQIGSTEQAMECDCAEEWGKTTMTSAPAV